MTTLEREWLASGLPVAALMEKVGLAMAAWFLARPELLREGVLVLVGPGHNGGDGLVVGSCIRITPHTRKVPTVVEADVAFE